MKFLYIFIFLFNINAYAQWSAINKTDNFTDKKIKYLSYKTKDTVIQIDIEERYNLFPRIAIERKKIGRISSKTAVEIRVDTKKNYKAEVGFWVNVYKENNTEMTSRTASLDNKKIVFTIDLAYYEREDFFCNLIQGNFLKLRYSLSDGSKEKLIIPLDGINKKIETVFGKKIISKCK